MRGVNIINYVIQVTTDVHRGDGPSGRRAQRKLSAEHIYIVYIIVRSKSRLTDGASVGGWVWSRQKGTDQVGVITSDTALASLGTLRST